MFLKNLFALFAFVTLTLLLSFGLLRIFTLETEVASLRKVIRKIEKERQPLIVVKGKYPYIVSSPKDIIVVSKDLKN